MSFKWILAYALAITIGGLCRRFGLPCPAPPTLLGGLLVFATTVGYWAGGYFLDW